MTSPAKKDNNHGVLVSFAKRKLFRHNFALVVCLTAVTSWKLSAVVHSHTAPSAVRVLEVQQHPAAVALAGWKNASQSKSQTMVVERNHPNGKSRIDVEPTLIRTYQGPSRVWKIRREGFPCFPGERQLMVTTPAHRGFLFHRPMKVGSTTMVSVVLRLAHNRSPWMARGVKCKHRSMHGSGLSYMYDKRDRSKSFLFSLVRDPTKRTISEFFHFGVAIWQLEPTDAVFRDYIHRHADFHHLYLNDLGLRNYTKDIPAGELRQLLVKKHNMTMRQFAKFVRKAEPSVKFRLMVQRREHMRFGPNANLTMVVEHILEDYDFIAVTERMDESLVAMQMLLNLTTKDILYTRARSSGSWSNGSPERPCVFIPPSHLSPNMKEYFESKEWKGIIRGDQLLYQAVNASLDRTIEALGRDRFQRNLDALHAGLKQAQENCKGRVRTQCTEGGEPVPPMNKTCYVWGEACDHECINELDL